MKDFFLFAILVSISQANASSKIVGGVDVPECSFFARPVIALLTEYKNQLRVNCTGTLIAPRVVLTAAHCIDKIVSNEIYVANGENPLASQERISVSHLLYYKPQFWDMNSFDDIAVLVLEKEFNSFEIAQLVDPSTLSIGKSVIQLGYGLQTFQPSTSDINYPDFGKLQMLVGKSKVSKIQNQRIETTSPGSLGVMGGDSGGPLFTLKENKLYLNGVLSQGGPSFGEVNLQTAYYTSPYYFISWINSVLDNDLRLNVSFPLQNQFPDSTIKVVPSHEFPQFNRDQCRGFRSGWDISAEDQVCWPSTKKSCEEFEREEVPGEVYWNSSTSVCAIID